MKLLIRYFSLGLLTAGILFLGILLFTNSGNEEDLSTEAMISHLHNEGYHVVTNEEYISISMNSTDNTEESKENKDSNKQSNDKDGEKKEKEQQPNKENEEELEEKEKTKTSYTLDIKSGMPTSSISSELETKGIIEDATEFTKYLEKHDFALKVKAKKVEVHSDMSFYEIAQALINY